MNRLHLQASVTENSCYSSEMHAVVKNVTQTVT